MTNLLTAALIAASLASSAHAGVTAQDKAWIEKMNFAVDDALSQSSEAPSKVGVVYVPITVDAKGLVTVSNAPQSCGCPDLDRAALDAVGAMGPVARPPADLVGQRILVKAVFKAAPAHGDLSRAQVTACGGA